MVRVYFYNHIDKGEVYDIIWSFQSRQIAMIGSRPAVIKVSTGQYQPGDCTIRLPCNFV